MYIVKVIKWNGKDINGVKILGIQGSYKYKPDDFPSFTQKVNCYYMYNYVEI